MPPQPEPHRVLHAAARSNSAQRPPSRGPVSGGASTHGEVRIPPTHWALATLQNAPGGRQSPGHGQYGPVGSKEHGASLAVAVQACAEAADQRPQAWATDEAGPAPSYHRCHPGQPHRPHPQTPPTRREGAAAVRDETFVRGILFEMHNGKNRATYTRGIFRKRAALGGIGSIAQARFRAGLIGDVSR